MVWRSKISRKSMSGSLLTLGGRAIIWRSIKQSFIANSTMEATYITAKKAFWLFVDLEVVCSTSKS